MGGSQSTRKLTIPNNDPANVIKVSDSVVQRFRGEAEGNLTSHSKHLILKKISDMSDLNNKNKYVILFFML